MSLWNRRHPQERGASLISFTLTVILVVIPLMGLAVDGAIAFWAKARLTTAVDSAALAAGRTPTANASTVASQYVYANFPAGWLGSSYSTVPVATVSYPSTGTRQVTVTATVTVPTHFLVLFGQRTTVIPATAAATRRNSNIILVLDRSSSMNITGPDGAIVCNTMVASATTFVNYFTDGQDRLGLITFQTWANVDFPMTKNFQSSSPNLTTVLSDLVCGAQTSSAMALNLAYQQIKNLGSAAYASNGALNVIIFFTDGAPNGITAVYPPKNQTDSRYYANPEYGSGRMNMMGTIDSSMPATTSQCQSSLPSAAPGAVVQGAAAAPTGLTAGPYDVSNIPTSTCASGQSRAICSTTLTLLSVPGCYFSVTPWNYSNPWPVTGMYAGRQDIAYIPAQDYYGNVTKNSAFMTQASDLMPAGPYYSTGAMRIDSPQSIADASFNAADAQALAIISDTTFKPVIYVIGLGGAPDAANQAVFQTFLERVANDPRSTRYNSSLPTGVFVYSPDDTQLASAFHQIASQILRLSK